MDAETLSTQFSENYRTYYWPELRCTTFFLEDSHNEVLELFGYGVFAILKISLPIWCPYLVWHVLNYV